MNAQVKDSIIPAIQVTDIAYQRQLVRKHLYYSNIIIWSVIFFYPLLGILDYVYAFDIYQTLLLVKVITIVIIYASYDICSRMGASPLIPVHITFFTLALNAAILCNLVPFEVAPVFFLLYTSLFMLFNMAVFWPPVYSFTHFFITVLMISLAFYFFNTGSMVVFITQGAGLFIMTGFFSCFIPLARHNIIKRNTFNDLRVKNSAAQLHLLHTELFRKNLEIEESNSRLTELVMQQDTFLSLVKQDINIFIDNINETAQSLRHTDTDLQFISTLQDNVSSLSQLIQLLPEENEAPASEIILQLQTVDIMKSLKDVSQCMSGQLKRYQINFENIPLKPSYHLSLDQLYFDQLLFNLLANCLKFSAPESKLIGLVKGSAAEPVLIITCISPQSHVPVYLQEKWYPDDPTTQSMQKGLGPGFYIARLLARKMNADLIYHLGNAYTAYEIRFKQN